MPAAIPKSGWHDLVEANPSVTPATLNALLTKTSEPILVSFQAPGWEALVPASRELGELAGRSYGYAVFPNVTKGGLGVGGAFMAMGWCTNGGGTWAIATYHRLQWTYRLGDRPSASSCSLRTRMPWTGSRQASSTLLQMPRPW
jgi:hypothetical protein